MSINETTKKELALVKSQTIKASQVVNELKIKNSDDLEVAKKQLTNLGVLKKFILEKKNKLINPAEAIIEEAKGLYSPFEEKIAEADKMVRQKMLDYNQVLRAEEDKQRLALEEEAKKNQREAKIENAVAKVEAIIEKREAIPVRKNRVIKIIDEAKVPKRYWILDLAKIREDAIGNGIEIPGVGIIIEEIIINR